ncbi:unnamed protein product [Symbiodinium natans]|uniref:Uncharacterized protein n=1 Tax=Symbiodinium natans TaxID=878477 RepID=A0A812N664_9DINO|nr:unnamed protein product [Symbiodinium natans]
MERSCQTRSSLTSRSEPLLRQPHKLPVLADKATSWFDASGWHHISFPTPYARDVRTRHKVLPRLLAKLVGPLAWDEAPRTPRAFREATLDFSERLSQPKQTKQMTKAMNTLSERRRSAPTQILSKAQSAQSLALTTVHLEERPSTSPASLVKPSSAHSPGRVVSMERLKALAEPRRRRSKFIRPISNFVKFKEAANSEPNLGPESEKARPRQSSARRGVPSTQSSQSAKPASQPTEHKDDTDRLTGQSQAEASCLHSFPFLLRPLGPLGAGDTGAQSDYSALLIVSPRPMGAACRALGEMC